MIKISKTLFLRSKIAATKPSIKIHNIQGVDHTLEACVCFNKEVDNLFDEELFICSKLRSPGPCCLIHYDPLQISFLNENGGISKRKPTASS